MWIGPLLLCILVGALSAGVSLLLGFGPDLAAAHGACAGYGLGALFTLRACR